MIGDIVKLTTVDSEYNNDQYIIVKENKRSIWIQFDLDNEINRISKSNIKELNTF